MKSCKKCRSEKDISEFYTHPAMKDGHLSFCKECVKERVAKRGVRDHDKILAYDRIRGRSDYRKAMAKERYEKMKKESPDLLRSKIKRYNSKRDPKKKWANSSLSNAICSGLIIRPEYCSKCGSTGKIEGHHEDYSKPLDVIWLCTKCHGETRRKTIPF